MPREPGWLPSRYASLDVVHPDRYGWFGFSHAVLGTHGKPQGKAPPRHRRSTTGGVPPAYALIVAGPDWSSSAANGSQWRAESSRRSLPSRIRRISGRTCEPSRAQNLRRRSPYPGEQGIAEVCDLLEPPLVPDLGELHIGMDIRLQHRAPAAVRRELIEGVAEPPPHVVLDVKDPLERSDWLGRLPNGTYGSAEPGRGAQRPPPHRCRDNGVAPGARARGRAEAGLRHPAVCRRRPQARDPPLPPPLRCKERRGAPGPRRAPSTTPCPAFLRLPRNRRASGVARYPRIAESKSSEREH